MEKEKENKVGMGKRKKRVEEVIEKKEEDEMISIR